MLGTLRIGLTGGIGSGKSTVAQLLAARGATVIDADAIARAATAPGGAAIGPIAQAFGAEFITPAGALDRDRMRALVFSQPQAKHRLESIVHPLVGAETDRQAKAAAQAKHSWLVFDVPLLVEAGPRWRHQLHQVLVIDCEVATQIERTMARSQLSQEQVQAIVTSQASRAQRLAAADIVLYNQGLSLLTLAGEVAHLANMIRPLEKAA